MKISSNLKTIGVKLLAFNEGDVSSTFTAENDRRINHDKEVKEAIIKKYYQIYARNPSLFQDVGLAPLSSIVAELFDKFTNLQILNSLKMLGTHSIDNYSEEMIFKLYEKYSSAKFMKA